MSLIRELDLTPEEREEELQVEADRYLVYHCARVDDVKKAIQALGSSAVPAFRQALAACSPEASEGLARAASLIGEAAVDVLPDWFEAALAKRVSPLSLVHAVLALRPETLPEGRSHVPLFLRALEVDDELLNRGAIFALRAVGPAPEALPGLTRCLARKRVARDAAESLIAYGPAAREAVSALIDILDVTEGGEVCRALAAIGGPAAVDALRRALASPRGAVRAFAATGLGEIGRPEHAGDLAALLSREADAWNRDRILAALARLRGLPPAAAKELDLSHPPVAAGAAIVEQLNFPDEHARYSAIQQIETLPAKPAEAIPLLADLLRDRRLGEFAAKALGSYGPAGAPAVPALIEALRHTSDAARAQAATALGKIGATEAIAPLRELWKRDWSSFTRGAVTDAIRRLESC